MDKEEKKVSTIDEAQKEIAEVLKKYNVKIMPSIDFPIYRQLPIEVKLALEVIGKHGARIKYVIEENSK